MLLINKLVYEMLDKKEELQDIFKLIEAGQKI